MVFSPNRFAAPVSRQPFSGRGTVSIAAVDFQNGRKSVRLDVSGGRAGIRQGRVNMEAGRKYDGSLWA